jgi:hypothetical protein
VKRNRFVQLTGRTRSVNRDLEAKAKALAAGLKGYITNLDAPTAAFVIGAYYQLWQVEKSFRMSKSDLRARPVFHHKATRSKPTSPWCSLLSPSPAGSKHHRLEHQEAGHDSAPLPHRPDQGRRPDRHRRRPLRDDALQNRPEDPSRRRYALIDQSQVPLC